MLFINSGDDTQSAQLNGAQVVVGQDTTDMSQNTVVHTIVDYNTGDKRVKINDPDGLIVTATAVWKQSPISSTPSERQLKVTLIKMYPWHSFDYPAIKFGQLNDPPSSAVDKYADLR